MAEGAWTTVAKASELPDPGMKRVELPGKEIVIVHVGGRMLALTDRCGHMNAPLSRGTVRASADRVVVTCPLHFSTFDVGTGKNLSGPIKAPPVDMTGTPKSVVETLARAAELAAQIRTHDLETYPVQRVGDEIQIKI